MFFVEKRDRRVEEYDEGKIRTFLFNEYDLYGEKNISSNDERHEMLKERDALLEKITLRMDSVKGMRGSPIRTSDILDLLINAASDLIDPGSPSSSGIAARLITVKIRKEAWKGCPACKSSCPALYDRIEEKIRRKMYDPVILDRYSREEVEQIDSEVLRHERDFDIPYSGCNMFYDKYLLSEMDTASGGDRRRVVETPQEVNILISMFLFMNESSLLRKRRIDMVRSFYDFLSTFVISLPTPIYSGLRTTLRSFSSCCTIDCADSVDGILAANSAIGKVVTQRFGVGLFCGRIRGIGSPIGLDRGRSGEARSSQRHGGVVPILKMFESSVKGFSQGVRGGSAAASFPFWHSEILTVIQLRNNKGVSENRVRGLDYSVGLNRLFLERVRQNAVVHLFSPHDVPRLVDCVAYQEFKQAYEEYEGAPGIQSRTAVMAAELLEKIVRERYETGRLYIYFIDLVNEYSTFDMPIFGPNLCQEIFLPTVPLDGLKREGPGDGDPGLSGICILSCVNLGRVSNPLDMDEMGRIASSVVRGLNNLIDYQSYPFPHLRRMAKQHRPLGIGVSDVFHLLARQHLKYDTLEGRNYVHRVMEVWQYSLLDASCSMAAEIAGQRGKAQGAREDGMHDELVKEKRMCVERGEMYIRKKGGFLVRGKESVESLVTAKLICPWTRLLARVKEYGLFNSCLSAVPPTSSSSLVSNSTPSVDPPRNDIIAKLSKHGVTRTVPPDYSDLREHYSFARDIDNESYIKFVSVIQKFVDQGISTNTFYLKNRTPSVGDLFKEIFSSYNYGLKSLYYLNTFKLSDDGNERAGMRKELDKDDEEEEEENEACTTGSCYI